MSQLPSTSDRTILMMNYTQSLGGPYQDWTVVDNSSNMLINAPLWYFFPSLTHFPTFLLISLDHLPNQLLSLKSLSQGLFLGEANLRQSFRSTGGLSTHIKIDWMICTRKGIVYLRLEKWKNKHILITFIPNKEGI